MAKRKFLKIIYDIQKNFGVGFAGVSRTFSLPSFITNHKRHFDEATKNAKNY